MAKNEVRIDLKDDLNTVVTFKLDGLISIKQDNDLIVLKLEELDAIVDS